MIVGIFFQDLLSASAMANFLFLEGLDLLHTFLIEHFEFNTKTRKNVLKEI